MTSIVYEISEYRHAVRYMLTKSPKFPRFLSKQSTANMFRSAFLFDRYGSIFAPTRVERRKFGIEWVDVESNFVIFDHPEMLKIIEPLEFDDLDRVRSDQWTRYVESNVGLDAVINQIILMKC
jgi:hypothetical protein